MNILVKVVIMIGIVLAADNVTARNDITLMINRTHPLKETVSQQTLSQRISTYLVHSHYRKFDLDATFSSKIFDRYLNMLDKNHNVLMASDIAPFAAKKLQLANELKNGKLDLPFAMYNVAEKRRFERYQYAQSQLNKSMDFSGNDIIEIDRSKAPWPETVIELDALWDAKVKYDELNLKLTGKDEKEIRDILTKRYQFSIQRLMKSNSEDVFQLIMNAFTHEIDPHTHYLSPCNTEQFNAKINLSLEGIGIVLKMDNDYAIVHSLVPKGPAAKSKVITVGDRVVGISQLGQPMTSIIGWRLDEVISLIKGPKGSKVQLEILPIEEKTNTHIVTITRERIYLEDQAVKVSVKTIDKEKVGILNIPRFYIGLTNDVKVQLKKLKKQNVKSVIVDLRTNSGGVLAEAVSFSGLFISSGPIVQIRDNNGKIKENSSVDHTVYYTGPLIVLVDRFSASASEIFAAAMQDYGRALIVGESTFGKGTVQQHHSLNRIYDQILHPEWPDLGSIQYTIQKFYRINGDSTQCKGVIPDIVMPMPSTCDVIKIGEKFEDNALPWDNIKKSDYIKVGDLKSYSTKLIKAHQARIAKNSEFQYIQQDIVRFDAVKNKCSNTILLNLEHQKKENDENCMIRLKRINERLIYQGKKPVENLKSIPKNYSEPDPCLDETVFIALDLWHEFKNLSIYCVNGNDGDFEVDYFLAA